MADLKKPSAKSKVEAILFSVGHRISLDEISKLSRSRKEDVLEALRELQQLGIVHAYPPLVDSNKGIVSQAEHSVLIDDDGKVIVLTKL